MFYVYVLERSKNDEIYTGFTTNLEKRIVEICTHELDARRRERYLKTTQGRRMLRMRLKEHFKNKDVD